MSVPKVPQEKGFFNGLSSVKNKLSNSKVVKGVWAIAGSILGGSEKVAPVFEAKRDELPTSQEPWIAFSPPDKEALMQKRQRLQLPEVSSNPIDTAPQRIEGLERQANELRSEGAHSKTPAVMQLRRSVNTLVQELQESSGYDHRMPAIQKKAAELVAHLNHLFH